MIKGRWTKPLILVGLLFLSGCTPAPTERGDSSSPQTSQSTRLPMKLMGASSNASGPITTVAWSRDSTRFATSSGAAISTDTTVHVWSNTGSLVAILTGHTKPVTSLVFSSDGKTLISGSLDQTVRFWNLTTASLHTEITLANPVYSLAWSRDEKTLAIGTISFQPAPNAENPHLLPLPGVIELWHADGMPRTTVSTQHTGGKFLNVAWSPDDSMFAAGAVDYQVWRADGTPVTTLRSGGVPAWGMKWAPDGHTIAIGDENGLVALYDLTGVQIAYSANNGSVSTLEWSPSGETIAVSSVAGVRLIRVKDFGTTPQSIYSSGTVSVAWSPNGESLALAAPDRTVKVWSTKKQSVVALAGCADRSLIIAWSPNGEELVAGLEGNSACLWTNAAT